MNRPELQYLTSSIEEKQIVLGDFIDLLEVTVARDPDKVVFYFLEDGIEEKERITYGEMHEKVRMMAAAIQSKYSKGERALLLFPPGIEFIVSLVACMYAGVIAVPAYPPRRNRNFNRFEAILEDSSPSFILTTQRIKEDISKNLSDHPVLNEKPFLIYEDFKSDLTVDWKKPETSPEDVIILQYTSGSTNEPRGVMITHSNILSNSEFIKIAFGHTTQLMGVNWLPGFHDMGLIGALIQPLYVGGSNVIIPPSAFLMRPHNWFKAISKYGGTTVGGPNFALDYCTDRIKDDELSGVDLKTVKPFFCGAEPIRKSSLEKFSQRFNNYGFNPESFYPCYGLAEATLIVTGGDLDADPVYFYADAEQLKKGLVEKASDGSGNAQAIVGCGYPMAGTSIMIVDPGTTDPCERGIVGEIWVSGPSVAKGYWGDPEGTGKTFNAFTSDGKGPFMRTGDLGFIEDGQLFVSGRLKDLIIIRGLNHYPQDIEHTVESAHEAINQGSNAAFSTEEGQEEHLVVVVEVKRSHLRDLDASEVFDALRNAIAENHQLEPYAIVLTRTGSNPKTSSGKIQRFECRKHFLEGVLQEVASWRRSPEEKNVSGNDLEEWLKNWISKEMKIPSEEILPEKLITSYGIGSLAAVKMARDAEDTFGIEWPLDLFFEEDITIRKLREEAIKLLG